MYQTIGLSFDCTNNANNHLSFLYKYLEEVGKKEKFVHHHIYINLVSLVNVTFH